MDFKQPKTKNKSKSSTKSTDYPGMWRFHTNPDYCSIYRVPDSIRRVNPEAFTPQLVLIGPLHHSLKSQALKSLGDITDSKSMGYLNMEEHKKIYLQQFEQEVGDLGGDLGIYRIIIEEEEEKIRESYSESTAWIKSSEFVEMILHDSVFVVQFLLNYNQFLIRNREKGGDPLMDEPCLRITIRSDLLLLENQLPYFILNRLFDRIVSEVYGRTFREFIIKILGFNGKIDNNTNFSHFTDLYRCVYTETLKDLTGGNYEHIKHMYNADKLASGGVKFEVVVENSFSLNVRFENGCLKMSCLKVYDSSEMELRNVMALEQCHYPRQTHVCNYIMFLDYLIDTDKDVELLVEKGILKNCIGQPSLVAEMVNKLNMGTFTRGSYYYDIAVQVNEHYTNRYQRSKAILKRVYFGNLWIGTATVAAVLLLLMTFIQTLASIIQVVQNAHK